MKDLLTDASTRGVRYVSGIGTRRVTPRAEDIERLGLLGGPMPEEPSDPKEVLALLDDVGSPATIASTGGRYFGFVTGATLPAALAANWIAGVWDQNSAMRVMSPVSAALEDITLGWLREALSLPPSTGVGFVTGATMANFSCLAAARHALLERAGWNVEDKGLFDAPPLKVVVSDEVHVSVLKALAMLGLGRTRVTRLPTDAQGRIKSDSLPAVDERTIICIQAGNVNTGAFDPAAEICSHARRSGAWVHVDGAFGLWAAAAPERAHLMERFADADSWATDCHKWLNVPYDSGLAFVRDPQHLRSAMTFSAAYLQSSDQREPGHYTPESSRRARAIEVWAALRSLGRRGLAGMIEGNCRSAQRFAGKLRAAGYSILNDVVLNQVLVSFGDAAATKRVISQLQNEGTCWCGATEWHGQTAMRISVSGWATTDEDVDQSAAAVLRVAASVMASAR
ncbi:MAG TPA: aminotransferase class V-fold PLP-dependent enzyme [Bryobacteraceae bacterium]|nr:aminotransferase class V-fold PLP-dependent enzyme [Bryobacteraceae bacterium]